MSTHYSYDYFSSEAKIISRVGKIKTNCNNGTVLTGIWGAACELYAYEMFYICISSFQQHLECSHNSFPGDALLC